jgi:hypothetical protein
LVGNDQVHIGIQRCGEEDSNRYAIPMTVCSAQPQYCMSLIAKGVLQLETETERQAPAAARVEPPWET